MITEGVYSTIIGVLRSAVEDGTEPARYQPPADCDRCKEPTPGVEMVKCHLGCTHWQCERCAAYTRREAADSGWHFTGEGTT